VTQWREVAADEDTDEGDDAKNTSGIPKLVSLDGSRRWGVVAVVLQRGSAFMAASTAKFCVVSLFVVRRAPATSPLSFFCFCFCSPFVCDCQEPWHLGIGCKQAIGNVLAQRCVCVCFLGKAFFLYIVCLQTIIARSQLRLSNELELGFRPRCACLFGVLNTWLYVSLTLSPDAQDTNP
jgi:hypothetical protein